MRIGDAVISGIGGRVGGDAWVGGGYHCPSRSHSNFSFFSSVNYIVISHVGDTVDVLAADEKGHLAEGIDCLAGGDACIGVSCEMN